MPTRYLKPGIRDSELIDRLSSPAEVLFYRLIVTVDDFGRADARPSMIKAACFPIKESATAAKCAGLLEELASAGVINLYEVDGKPYLQMQKWDNAPRAKESRFPAPADTCAHMHASARTTRTLLPGTETGTETETGKAPRTRRATAPSVDKPEGVEDQVWSDWLELRKKKRAPVTKTVVEGSIAEARKAGMTLNAFLRIWCRRGSQGLEADWLKPDEKRSGAEEHGDWRDTRTGIEAMGVELGIGSWDEEAFSQSRGEHFPAYRARVERAWREREHGPVDKAGMQKIADLLGNVVKKVA